MTDYFVHESAYVDQPCQIGVGTKIWHFCHIMTGAQIGENCNLGQNVMIASDVVIGNRVKIQNNVSLYSGTLIEDDVFLGPSCVLTNISNPRSQIIRRGLYEKTTLKKGCSVGANSTIVCGVTIGRYAFLGAGTVVTQDVPDYALILGVPGKQVGWMSRHGHRLPSPDANQQMVCPESGYRYQLNEGELFCLDLDEEAPLPEAHAQATKSYQEVKRGK